MPGALGYRMMCMLPVQRVRRELAVPSENWPHAVTFGSAMAAHSRFRRRGRAPLGLSARFVSGRRCGSPAMALAACGRIPNRTRLTLPITPAIGQRQLPRLPRLQRTPWCKHSISFVMLSLHPISTLQLSAPRLQRQRSDSVE